MVTTTLGFGGVLIALGVVAYIASAAASVTALIPAFIGAIVLVLALLARAKPALARPLLLAAVAIAVLAVFGSSRGVGGFVALLRGDEVARPMAAVVQTLTLVLSVAYIAFMLAKGAAARSGPAA